jgi:hypothetical protein
VTEEEIDALKDDALTDAVVVQILGWREADTSRGEDLLYWYDSLNQSQELRLDDDGDYYVFLPKWDLSTNLDNFTVVEKRIDEMGLKYAYLYHLMTWDEPLDTAWKLVTLTPEAKCRAALKAIQNYLNITWSTFDGEMKVVNR